MGLCSDSPTGVCHKPLSHRYFQCQRPLPNSMTPVIGFAQLPIWPSQSRHPFALLGIWDRVISMCRIWCRHNSRAPPGSTFFKTESTGCNNFSFPFGGLSCHASEYQAPKIFMNMAEPLIYVGFLYHSLEHVPYIKVSSMLATSSSSSPSDIKCDGLQDVHPL